MTNKSDGSHIRVAGAVAGVGSVAYLTNNVSSFDTVKTRMQCSPPGTYRGAIHCLSQIVRNEVCQPPPMLEPINIAQKLHTDTSQYSRYLRFTREQHLRQLGGPLSTLSCSDLSIITDCISSVINGLNKSLDLSRLRNDSHFLGTEWQVWERD
ncbi:hypothetical protein PHLCEN_2v535 [Hermanssonia centrifuga]|uniref:Uncharacterized protein n=1 Tax=Hermanssonia centrifuga TaxID=98765 RepID=A0A2R6S5P9_9APHY|nr:hypothetical protein PHLCEN_2v535 [Hermanssonia centrifuga]